MAVRIIDYRFWGIRKINRAIKLLNDNNIEFKIVHSGTTWLNRKEYLYNDIWVYVSDENEEIVQKLKTCK